MQLTSLRRAMFAGLGLGATTTGVVCAAHGWTAASVPLIVAGILVIAAAIIGQIPSGNLKELQLRWRDQELYDRVIHIEQALSDLGKRVDAAVQNTNEITTAVANKLDEYILALEPDPDDGYADAEQRLRDWEQQLAELDSEISSRRYTGEHYDDGVSLEQLTQTRETSARELDHERRRQEARRKYEHLRNVPPN